MALELVDDATGRYLPLLYPEEKPYWDAAKKHRLVLQCCNTCDRAFFPVGPCCPFCFSEDFRWQEMSGKGKISNVVVYHKGWTPYLQKQAPYAVIQVQLEEGPRLTTNFIGNQSEAKIGASVDACWEDVTDKVSLINFRPVQL